MSDYILTRIDAIQQELEALKKILAAQNQSDHRSTQPRGIWKGVDISDQLLEEAKKSAFSTAYNWQE